MAEHRAAPTLAQIFAARRNKERKKERGCRKKSCVIGPYLPRSQMALVHGSWGAVPDMWCPSQGQHQGVALTCCQCKPVWLCLFVFFPRKTQSKTAVVARGKPPVSLPAPSCCGSQLSPSPGMGPQHQVSAWVMSLEIGILPSPWRRGADLKHHPCCCHSKTM